MIAHDTRPSAPTAAPAPRPANVVPASRARLTAAAFATLLLLLAAPPRFAALATTPPALNADELGNVAPFLRILRTGRDLDGRLLPLTYHRLTRRPPLYGLLATPAVLALGKHAVAVRLPAALLGLAGIFLLWALADRLLQRRGAGVLAAALMAATPWHIHYSRIGWEPATVVPLIVLAVLLWVRAVEAGRPAGLAAAAAVLGLGVYGYKAFDVLGPLWLAGLLLLYRRAVRWRTAALVVGAYAAVMLPFVATSLLDPSMHRWAGSIFVFAGGVTPAALGDAAARYVAHFGPGFLFISGDPNTRHHAPGTGQLFWWMAPLLVLGLSALARRRDLRHRGVLILWLLLFPVAGALTTDQPVHASRTIVGLPGLALVAALGVLAAADWIRRQRARGLLALAAASALAVGVVGEGVRFMLVEFVRYPLEAWDRWDYGHAEVFETLWARRDAYDRVCLGTVDWWHVPTYAEYYLVGYGRPVITAPDDPACRLPRSLIVVEGGTRPPATVLERVVRDPTGGVRFVVYGRPR